MERFKNWTIGILMIVVAILLSLRDCGHEGIGKYKGNIIRVDTVITQNIILPKDTIYKYVFNKSNSRLVRDSIYIHDTIQADSNLCDYIRMYRDTIEDENVILYTADSIQGRYLGGEFDYKLKVPIEIDKTITITKIKYPAIKLDMGLMTDTKFNTLEPFVCLGVRKFSFLAGYNLNNGVINIGVQKTIFAK